MSDPFDIFKMEENGSVKWVLAISDFERAKSYIKILTTRIPANYIILSQKTGVKTIIENRHAR